MYVKVGEEFTMSTMLEQAIVDAKALKEAALKNAEALIVEKYAQEIKEAVNSLLEQDEEDPMADPMADPLAVPGAAGEMPDDSENELHPTAASLPDSFEAAGDTPIEINLDELAAEVEQAMGEFESHEDAAEDVEAGALQEPPSGQPEAPMQENTEAEEALEEETGAIEEDAVDVTEAEEVDINEEELLALLEKMIVDAEATKSGHMNRPDAELQHEEDIAMAKQAETGVNEEETEAAENKIEEENKILASAGLKIQKENTKLREALDTLQNKLVQINVSNAKLLYINQTLSNTSLNERQKQKIVEAISKTESVKEAKVIFETLQSSVGILEKEKIPQSLSEAVNRRPSLMVAARQRNKEKDNGSPFFDRMQKLAGIKD